LHQPSAHAGGPEARFDVRHHPRRWLYAVPAPGRDIGEDRPPVARPSFCRTASNGVAIGTTNFFPPGRFDLPKTVMRAGRALRSTCDQSSARTLLRRNPVHKAQMMIGRM